METVTLAKFLRHLSQCSLEIIEKPELEAYDIARLKRELLELKRHIDGKEPIHPEVLRDILDLDVRVDEKLIGSERSEILALVARRIFPAAALLYTQRRSERMEEARRQIEDFHSSLDHIQAVLGRSK